MYSENAGNLIYIAALDCRIIFQSIAERVLPEQDYLKHIFMNPFLGFLASVCLSKKQIFRLSLILVILN